MNVVPSVLHLQGPCNQLSRISIALIQPSERARQEAKVDHQVVVTHVNCPQQRGSSVTRTRVHITCAPCAQDLSLIVYSYLAANHHRLLLSRPDQHFCLAPNELRHLEYAAYPRTGTASLYHPSCFRCRRQSLSLNCILILTRRLSKEQRLPTSCFEVRHRLWHVIDGPLTYLPRVWRCDQRGRTTEAMHRTMSLRLRSISYPGTTKPVSRRLPCCLATRTPTSPVVRPFSTTCAHRVKQMPPRPKPPPDSEIKESYLKGSGPGGQKIV